MDGATKATYHQGVLVETLQEMLQLRGKRRHLQLNETYNFGTKGAKKKRNNFAQHNFGV